MEDPGQGDDAGETLFSVGCPFPSPTAHSLCTRTIKIIDLCPACHKEIPEQCRGIRCLVSPNSGLEDDHIQLGTSESTRLSSILARIRTLEQEVDQLRTHIEYAPGGPGMLAAKADFEDARSSVRACTLGDKTFQSTED